MKIISLHQLIRLISVFTVAVVSLCASDLCLGLVAGTAVAYMNPRSYEDATTSLVAGIASFFCFSLMSLLVKDKALCVLVVFFSILAYSVLRASKRYSRIGDLFRNTAVWHFLEDYTSMICFLIFAVLSMAVLLSVCHGASCHWSLIVLLVILYALLYLRAYSGSTILIPREKERMIKEIIKGNLRAVPPSNAEDSARMTTMYQKVISIMEVKQPFLDPDFCIEDLAAMVFTNKVYISRTINLSSGRNFRQFLNYYRVNYSLELMRKDPRLKIQEVAYMSGFHTVVSYNMAFKLNMNRTPTEYLAEVRQSSLESPR